MDRSQLLLRAWLFLLLVLTATQLSAATKVALVSNGGAGDVINAAIDLATVRLSSASDFTLLERKEIDRVLDEHKLSLGGLVNAEQAVSAGKLLTVDLFAVVETAEQGKLASGLVVFDAQSGLRLADETLAGNADVLADRIVQSLRDSLAKRERRERDLRPICLLSVRNADLPREQDSVCQSVALLLERGLLKSPGVAILERKRLEHVNQERRVTGSAAGKLWKSLLIVELELGRDESGKGFRATALLTDVEGKVLRKFTAAIDRQNVPDLSRELQSQLTESFGGVRTPASLDAGREAARFAQEAALLHAHRDFEQAVRACEAACALAPNQADYRDALVRYLLDNVNDLLMPPGRQNVPANFGDQPIARNIEYAAAQFSRAMDLRLEAFHARQPFDLQSLSDHHQAFFSTDGHALFPALRRIAHVRPQTDEQQQQLGKVRDKCRQFCIESADEWAKVVKANPAAMFRYSGHMSVWLESLPFFSASADEYFANLTRFARHWLQVLAAAGPVNSPNGASDLTTIMQRILSPNADYFSVAFGLDKSDYAKRMDELLQAMREHLHPVVRLYGDIGRLWQQEFAGKLTLPVLESQFEPIRAEAMRVIDNPAPSHTVFSFADADAYQAELLHIIERSLDMIDQGRVETFGESAEGVRFSLKSMRIRLLSRLSRKTDDAAQPWRSVRQVFEIGQLPVVSAIKRGVVFDGTYYCLATRSRSGESNVPDALTLCAVAVPLDGSPPKQMGELPPPSWPPFGEFSVRDTAVGTREFCAAITGLGVAIFPLDGTPARIVNAAAGLPTNDAHSVAVLGRTLYVGLGEGGYLIAYDLDSRQVKVLASAGRRDVAGPLDNTGKLSVPCLITDREQDRVLAVAYVDRPGSERDRRNGIWQIDAQSGQLQQIRQLYTTEPIRWASQVSGERVLLTGTGFVLSYDTETNRIEVLQSMFAHQFAPDVRSEGRQGNPLLSGPPPYARHNGWLWSGGSWRRISLTDHRLELLAPIETADKWIRYEECLSVLPGGIQLLVANRSSVWLLDFSEE